MCASSTYPDPNKDLYIRRIGVGLDPGKELHACGMRWLRHFKMPFDSGDFSIECLKLLYVCDFFSYCRNL